MRMKHLLAVLLGLAPTLVLSQAFPTRTVTLVCPFPPGSSSDLIPRALAPLMSQSLGVSVVVENKPGAAGSIGAAQVAKAPPDGHTVLMTPTGVLAINQWLYKSLPYDPEKDLVPVINAGTTPNLLVVHPSVPARNLKELIALAQAKPGGLSYASGGAGTTSHLCGELLKLTAQVDLVHVPYKGPAPAHQDLLAGRVPIMCDNLSNVLPYVRDGRLRAIALTADQRHPQAPEIPTAAQAGLPGLEVEVWYGFAAPAGTPAAVVQKLNSEFAKALHDPGVTARLQSLGLSVVADSPEHFAKFVAAEADKWHKVVQASGARVD
jgi:tripartite-type tricarboxylate transporter receptor subunit TctC